jgi:hypothetical protein
MQDPPRTLICLDPGETTGMAIFNGLALHHCGQLDTSRLDLGANAFKSLLKSPALQALNISSDLSNVHVIIEDYKVYGWKTEQHTWAELHTPKLIGAFVALCIAHNLPYSMQMAVQAKQFCTDDKLKAWNLYKPGLRHARDAIRHGIYFALFDKSHKQQNK